MILYSSPSIIRIIKSRKMRWSGHVARTGRKRNAYRLLVGKPEGRNPLGRTKRRWVGNIKMDLGEIGWGDVAWIGLDQGRDKWKALVNSVLHLRVPNNARKFSFGCTTVVLSSRPQLQRVSQWTSVSRGLLYQICMYWCVPPRNLLFLVGTRVITL
jgi:hypothetical protein